MKKGIIIVSILGTIISILVLILVIILNIPSKDTEDNNYNLSIYKYEHTGEFVYADEYNLNYKDCSINFDSGKTIYWVDDSCIIYEKNQMIIYEEYNNRIELFDYTKYHVSKMVKRDQFLYISCTKNKYYKFNILSKNMESIDESFYEKALYGDFYRAEEKNRSIEIHNIKDSSYKTISYNDLLNCNFILEMKKMYIGSVEFDRCIIHDSNIYFFVRISTICVVIMKYDYDNETYEYYDWITNIRLNYLKIFFITENVGYPLLKYFHF